MSTLTGKLIKTQRKALKLKQKDVAKELGISAVFLVRIEGGACKLPPHRAADFERVLLIPPGQMEYTLQADNIENLKKKLKKKNEK